PTDRAVVSVRQQCRRDRDRRRSILLLYSLEFCLLFRNLRGALFAASQNFAVVLVKFGTTVVGRQEHAFTFIGFCYGIGPGVVGEVPAVVAAVPHLHAFWAPD